jgi:uncharacterized membrane protein YeaQ/YmgE (transglycosylase-associated protein family)
MQREKAKRAGNSAAKPTILFTAVGKPVDGAPAILLNSDSSRSPYGRDSNWGSGNMEAHGLIIFLIVGLIAGWLAGQIMKGGGYGLIGDLIVGIIGAIIGGWIWGVLQLPGIGVWWLTDIIIATIGACILLFILRMVKRA